MEEAVRTSESPFVDLTLAGMSLAEMGFVNNAIQALRRLRSVSSDDPFFLRRRDAFEHLLQGSIDQSRGENETASAHFSAVEQLHRGDAIFLLAREKLARVTLQRDEAAAVELFISLLDRRGEVVMAFLPTVRDGGVWTSRFWPETHLELGRIYTNRGDYGAAAGHLKAALEIWEGSDEDFQYAREARRLAALADMNQFITTD
jgi:tetratricopeptide (TPR) repeat protein